MDQKTNRILNHLIEPNAKGMFSAKMRGGCSISVAKSVLQKSIRRGYCDLANISGLLWFETGLLLVGLLTNLINRLIVIAGEDCGANLKFLHWVNNQVNSLRQLRKKVKGQDLANAQQLKIIICQTITGMAQSPKTRISSWMNGVFYDGLNCEEVVPMVENIYPGILQLKTQLDSKPDQAHQLALTSKYPLLSIRYAVKAHIEENKTLITLIWKRLFEIKDDENIRLFNRWYNDENEGRIYLVLAHIYICHPNWFDHSDWTYKEPSLNDLLNLENRAYHQDIEIPEWMIDLHTVEGKKKGMNKADFANVGSKIENIWMPMFSQKWIDVYETLKKMQPSVSKPTKTVIPPAAKIKIIMKKIPIKTKLLVQPKIKIIEKKSSLADTLVLDEKILNIIMSSTVPRGQKITSSWKPYVYLPKEYPHWVFKGPFLPKRFERLDKLNKRYLAFKLLGTPIVDLEILTDYQGQKWVKYKNIATTPPDQWVTKTEYDKINQMEVQTIVRESLGFMQLSKLSHSEAENLLFNGHNPLYLAFLDATLFGCGDLGEHNALVVQGSPSSCYIIDYDDSTTRTEFKTYYDVYRGIKSNAQKIMFDQRVPTIKSAIITRIQLYKSLQSQLESCLGEDLKKIIDEMEKVYV